MKTKKIRKIEIDKITTVEPDKFKGTIRTTRIIDMIFMEKINEIIDKLEEK